MSNASGMPRWLVILLGVPMCILSPIKTIRTIWNWMRKKNKASGTTGR